MKVVVEKISEEEYFNLEKSTEERYEYLWGEIQAVSGATAEHTLIVNNLIAALQKCMLKQKYLLMNGESKMYTEGCDKAFFYPDIHIYCGDLQIKKLPEGAYACKFPKIIMEVLSKTTRNYDKGDKFDCYRKINSLELYILIESQRDKDKEVMIRKDISETEYSEYTLKNMADTIHILGCEISLEEIYEGYDLIKVIED